MNPNLIKLAQAQGRMPYFARHNTGTGIMLTLLFWHMASSLWQRASVPSPDAGGTLAATPPATQESHQIIMSDDCLFSTCFAITPAEPGNAIQTALIKLAELQPHGALNNVLRPERFVFLASFLAQNHDTQALFEIVEFINMMTFTEGRPSLACGSQFLAAITSLSPQHNRPVRDAATLMARLLKPQPGEIVFDPACGQGHALMACALELTQHFPKAAPRLNGLEADQDHWSLAKMLMMLSGMRHAQLANVAALAQSMTIQEAQALSPADIVLTIIPDKALPWSHALALRARDPRFPVRPPVDSRVALVWHALASLKPNGGRMAILISHAALATTDGDALRRYLVMQNLLEAVIDLPIPSRACTGRADTGRLPLLLIIRHQKAPSAIAFIGQHQHEGQFSLTSEADMGHQIVTAYAAFQQQQAHDALLSIDNAIVTNHHCLLDVRAYGVNATRMNE